MRVCESLGVVAAVAVSLDVRVMICVHLRVDLRVQVSEGGHQQ